MNRYSNLKKYKPFAKKDKSTNTKCVLNFLFLSHQFIFLRKKKLCTLFLVIKSKKYNVTEKETFEVFTTITLANCFRLQIDCVRIVDFVPFNFILC